MRAVRGRYKSHLDQLKSRSNKNTSRDHDSIHGHRNLNKTERSLHQNLNAPKICKITVSCVVGFVHCSAPLHNKISIIYIYLLSSPLPCRRRCLFWGICCGSLRLQYVLFHTFDFDTHVWNFTIPNKTQYLIKSGFLSVPLYKPFHVSFLFPLLPAVSPAFRHLVPEHMSRSATWRWKSQQLATDKCSDGKAASALVMNMYIRSTK